MSDSVVESNLQGAGISDFFLPNASNSPSNAPSADALGSSLISCNGLLDLLSSTQLDANHPHSEGLNIGQQIDAILGPAVTINTTGRAQSSNDHYLDLQDLRADKDVLKSKWRDRLWAVTGLLILEAAKECAISPSYFYESIAQLAKVKGKARQTNGWNAFHHFKLKEENQGMSARGTCLYTDMYQGRPKGERVKMRDVMGDMMVEYKSLDEERIEKMKMDLEEVKRERRENTKTRPSKAKARFVADNLNRAELLVSSTSSLSWLMNAHVISSITSSRLLVKLALSYRFEQIQIVLRSQYYTPRMVYMDFSRRNSESPKAACWIRPASSQSRRRMISRKVRVSVWLVVCGGPD